MRKIGIIAAAAALVLAACQDSSVQPGQDGPRPEINLDISDGRNVLNDPGANDNPFLFFIPPLADQVTVPETFEFDLTTNVTIEICQMQQTATVVPQDKGKDLTVWTVDSVGGVPAGCRQTVGGNDSLVAVFGPPYESPSSIDVDPGTSHYHVDWSPSKQLVSSGPFFRIIPRLGSTYANAAGVNDDAKLGKVFTTFGFRDIEMGGSGSSSDDFAGFNGNVAIKFELYQGAVCFGKGDGLECGFGTIDPAGGAAILGSQKNALFVADANTTINNVNIFILEKPFPCLPVDFPQYAGGDLDSDDFCYEINAIPANAQFAKEVAFGVCPKVEGRLYIFGDDPANLVQVDRIRAHKLPEGVSPTSSGATGKTEVLPIDPSLSGTGCSIPQQNGLDFTSPGSNVFWNLAQGLLKTVLKPLQPEPLYASMMFFSSRTGSRFECCSTLGFALPAGLTGEDRNGTETTGDAANPIDLGVVSSGSAVPVTVHVRDVGGDPVAEAVVRFADPNSGSFTATIGTPVNGSVIGNPQDGADGSSYMTYDSTFAAQNGGPAVQGIISGSWTPASAGVQTLTASGWGYGPEDPGTYYPENFVTDTLTATQVGITFKVLVCDAATIPTINDGAVTAGDGYQLIGSFDANVSGGSAIPTSVYAASDCENLYVAVVVERDGTEKANTLRIDYDDDRGGADEGRTLGDDWMELNVGETSLDTPVLATRVDGFIDGSCFKGNGSFGKANCGSTDATADGEGWFTVNTTGTLGSAGNAWVYETKKSLTGTPGEDMNATLAAGLQIGVQVLLRMGEGAHGGTLGPAELGTYYVATVIAAATP
jgi:hypothetical protein